MTSMTRASLSICPSWLIRTSGIQRTGYENSSRSHFEGTDIWSTANPSSPQGTGWLGRYLDTLPSPLDPLAAWSTVRETPRTLMARTVGVPSIPNVRTDRIALLEIVANLDGYLERGEPCQRLTLRADHIREHAAPRLYDVPLEDAQWALTATMLLVACDPAPREPREDDKALLRAIEAPQDKARAVEADVLEAKRRNDEKIEEQGG